MKNKVVEAAQLINFERNNRPLTPDALQSLCLTLAKNKTYVALRHLDIIRRIYKKYEHKRIIG